ncbi:MULTISPECIES: hypothetical protein [Halomonas]|uniref:hypothetical protein n=1 Tax=Halomonas TaxID=2745 RepID=UPI001C96D82B|nr:MULTISPECIES: hypothetical protein [Halomonas]MBY6209103.1 hypothetical protein [Halomonas sp. DP3Y7-2]MBY6229259.1 hypothetical protein [Halomonas sp. DP3Y7-1]MCA0917678.1 hypothetical protein [Halomonas denitrificans]
MHQVWRYVLCLTEEERVRFQRQARRDDYRVFYASMAGIATTVAIFLSQAPWHGVQHPYHFYATWWSVPIGLIVGLWTWHEIRWQVYRQRRDVWWPILQKRWTGSDLTVIAIAPPETFGDIINRRIVTLTPLSGAGIGVTMGFILLMMSGPLPQEIDSAVARLAIFATPAWCAILGALAGKRYRDSFARRYSRLK